jgi:hypothetical protein
MSIRRIALVAAAALVPLIPSAPAYAADHVICVNNPVGVTCDETAASLSAAVAAANGNGLDDTIRVAPGHYSDGPYTLDGSLHHVTLQGSGQGSTFLDLPASPSAQNYLSVASGAVRDLTVVMNSLDSDADTGISTSSGSEVTSVTVSGLNAQAVVGLRGSDTAIAGLSVQLSTGNSCNCVGVFSDGGLSVMDSSIRGATGYSHSALAGDALSRLHITASAEGIWTDIGPLTVDDSVVDLGTSSGSHGLAAYNTNPGADPTSISADHVSIVGGDAGSVGVYAEALSPGVEQHAAVELTNSIVSGPETSLQVAASNDGTPGANSVATITTSYSDWSTSMAFPGSHGFATITSGSGHLNVNPGFRDSATGDYRLAATSPVIDKGAPGTGAPTLDLGKGARILDGNGDGIAVRDMGAYESPTKVIVAGGPDTTAPNTTITSHPTKRTTKRRATFRFTAHETHVTFQCRMDKKAWSSCTSPRSYRVSRGWHVFKVRARDAAGNLDASPARFRFHRV